MSTNTKEVTEDYTLVSTIVIPALFKELATKEFAVVMALMPFISYNDGILRCNGQIATGKMISDALEEKYETFKKILSSLIKKEVVKKIQIPSETYRTKTRKCLVANPYIYRKRKNVASNILENFQESRWANITGNNENYNF